MRRPRQRKQRRKEGNPLGAPGAPGTLRGVSWEYLEDLRVRQQTPAAVESKAKSLRVFLAWCDERGLLRPEEVTRPILERYQRHLFYSRKRDGRPLGVKTQYERLMAVRLLFRWLMRHGLLLANPASELEMPKLPQVLPQAVLSPEEVGAVSAQPKLTTPDGLRDKAMLELLYSTGLRRFELAALRVFDLDTGRGTLWVRQGKGRKDRVIPVGERAQAWVEKYLEEGRPKLAASRDEGVLFLGDAGEGLHPDYLTQLVRHYLVQAGLQKPGACHLFRHSMATAMLEGGADVRFVQEMLGHVSLETTQLYTRVTVEKLKAVHSATHPGAKLERTKPVDENPSSPDAAELLSSLAAESEQEDTDSSPR
jgi:integrase/recombinase XerD